MFKLTDMKKVFRGVHTLVELPRAERLTPSGIGALYGPESPAGPEATLWPASVKNISSTGIYLATEKRLRTGEVINLVLMEEEGVLLEDEHAAKHPECRFSIHARVARQGEDGLGLSFVLPPGLDSTLWSVLVRNIVKLTERHEIEEMFRILRTILFLCHLCHSHAGESISLMGGQLTSKRVDTLIKIAIAAEDQLALEPDYERRRAHPTLLTYLLREGSWGEGELLPRLWSGLLVSSCEVAAANDANHLLARLLSHMGPEQVRIYVSGCKRALTLETESERCVRGAVVVDIEEMKRITDRTDLTRPGVVMAQLFNLGLLVKLFSFASYIEVESYDITPSKLGLELYKHCLGQRGKLDAELVEKAEACLATLFEEPMPVAVVTQDVRPAWERFGAR
jgi:hypothetical protein